jgi:hypothetical protein
MIIVDKILDMVTPGSLMYSPQKHSAYTYIENEIKYQ